MKKKQAAKLKENENPIWTAKDFERAVRFTTLPRSLQEKLSSRKRGPQKSPTKVPISIRLSPDVAEGLRATGTGWQARADEALRVWLAKRGKIAARSA
jgi:uncharacterized protein (DUF4415 family)